MDVGGLDREVRARAGESMDAVMWPSPALADRIRMAVCLQMGVRKVIGGRPVGGVKGWMER